MRAGQPSASAVRQGPGSRRIPRPKQSCLLQVCAWSLRRKQRQCSWAMPAWCEACLLNVLRQGCGCRPLHTPQQMLDARPRATHSHLWLLQMAAAISVVLEGTVTTASMQGIEDAIEALTHQRWGVLVAAARPLPTTVLDRCLLVALTHQW